MRVTNLYKPLMDLIPNDYKLCIDRDFDCTILTLRHGIVYNAVGFIQMRNLRIKT